MKWMLGIIWVLLLAISPVQAQETSETADESSTATEVIPAEAVEETPPVDIKTANGDSETEPFVVICPIEGEIDEGVAVVVERAAREAEGAEALLFVINTPGGRVDSAIEITSAIMSVDCPTIAYIEGMGAISAGAIISYACDFIYMAEGTNIGASTPIMPGVETTEAMDEKSNSFVRGKYRALGEANGHDPLLGEAMVDRNMEVRGYRNPDGTYHIFKVEDSVSRDGGSKKSKSGDVLDKILDAVSEDGGDGSNDDITEVLKKILGAAAGVEESSSDDGAAMEDDEYNFIVENTELISARGELLTMTSKEATHFGLSTALTTDVDDTLREFLLGSVNRKTITPTWEESLFALLTSPTIAGLLLMAGLGGIYVEVRTPGFGAPGIIGTVCLALFFGSHMVIGMTDWIDVALIIAGFLLILAEMFLLPGFGLAGILGFVCLMGGAYLALVQAPIPDFSWDVTRSQEALYTLSVGFFAFIAFAVLSGFVLPYTPLGSALIMSTVLDNESGYTSQTSEEAQSALGLKGVAASALRPAGKGRFGKKKYDVVTRGEFLDKDTPIEIIQSDGNRYVVTEREETTDA